MSIFNDKSLKGVAAAVSKIMDEELKGNQHKIDANKNGKIDSHDFKLLRAKKTMKEEEQLDELSKATVKSYVMKKMEKPTTTKKDVKGMTNAYNRLKNYKPTSEEVELDEAFPTVDDAKKRMNAGKTATGSVTKTKTGLVHKRDYKDDDNDAEDTPKKSKGYGARQNMGKRGQSDGTKKTMKESKLSFTEMVQLYNEAGVEVINKIAPQTVKFGDTEVELIDANIVNGAVGITVAEEVDNETFTKEVEAQKEKNAGGGKKAEVAKASVQAVKQEEVEQIDELSKSTLGSYIKKASHDVASKGAITRHFADKSRRETEEKKHDLAKDSMKRSDKVFASGWKRREGMAKAVDRLTKEETQLDEKLPASASAGDYIHDFVHSDNPKFSGKSTKERQKMALGAFYAKNKGK